MMFPKTLYSLSKICTYISIAIPETQLRLDLHIRETYEPMTLIQLFMTKKWM